MADLDDLLGGPSPAAKVDPLADMDDLLGGSPAPQTAAFDDDLLFGGSPKAASPTAPAPAPAGGGGGGNAAVDLDLDLAPNDAPATRKRSAAVKEISIPVLDKFSTHLEKFVSGTTYFARFIQTIDQEEKKSKSVMTITDTTIYLMTEEVKATRSINVSSVIGLITQNIAAKGFFAKKDDKECHVLLQCEGEADIYFALGNDDRNGNTGDMLDIIQVLTSICMAHGHALPVSTLKDEENIHGMVKWKVADDNLRKQLTEALAFRTELINEINRLTKQDAQLEVSITSLKNSTAGQAASDLNAELTKLQETIQTFNDKNEQLEQKQIAAKDKLKSLNDEIAKEEENRAQEVQNTVEAAGRDQLMRQVAEYEMMKAAHKREMDKIAAVTSFFDRRVNSKGTGAFNGTGALSLRIDDLEDDFAFLTEKLAERSDDHTRRIKALAEGKKRVAQGKELEATLKTEIETIKKTPLTEEIPSHIALSELPPLQPVKTDDIKAPVITSPEMKPVKHQDPVVASSPAAPAPAINLSDDDDI